MVKTEGNQVGSHTLYISPFLNNRVFHDEVFRIYTNIGVQHTGNFKTIFRHAR